MDGLFRASVTEVDTFTIFGVAVPKVAFIVAGQSSGGAVGFSAEYLSHRRQYDWPTVDASCSRTITKPPRSYWSAAAETLFGDRNQAATRMRAHKSSAFLNSTKIRVLFDTGSQHSVLSRSAARLAGISRPARGRAGRSHPRLRSVHRKTFIAPVASFKIRDEEIRHTRLRFVDKDIVPESTC